MQPFERFLKACRHFTTARFMKYPGKNTLGLIICIALGTFTTHAVPAATQTEAEAELTTIRKMIRTLSSRLGYARSKREMAEEKLRAAELAIGRLAEESRALDNEFEQQQKQWKELRRQRDRKTKALVLQRDALARQIRLSYAMGRQDYLKIFLNQEDPSKLARMLTYYRYFNRARTEQIEATRLHLERIDALEKEIDKKNLLLEELKRTKEKARRDLEKQRARRKAALAGIAREISRDDLRLARLTQNKNRLEELITALRQKQKSFGHRKPFRRMRGQLQWPVTGSIRNRFGAKRDLGQLTWQGVMISAESGQAVRAISFGQIVFADWLRGFGLLLIIDHGDGYMSLYGHNQSLYKRGGDWAEPGEIIASVGNSGGNAEEGLYFEIRHQGYPQDPAPWCK